MYMYLSRFLSLNKFLVTDRQIKFSSGTKISYNTKFTDIPNGSLGPYRYLKKNMKLK